MATFARRRRRLSLSLHSFSSSCWCGVPSSPSLASLLSFLVQSPARRGPPAADLTRRDFAAAAGRHARFLRIFMDILALFSLSLCSTAARARAHQQSQSGAAVAGSPAGPPAPPYVLGAGVTLPAASATAVGLPPSRLPAVRSPAAVCLPYHQASVP